jgi:hypothetical protein
MMPIMHAYEREKESNSSLVNSLLSFVVWENKDCLKPYLQLFWLPCIHEFNCTKQNF